MGYPRGAVERAMKVQEIIPAGSEWAASSWPTEARVIQIAPPVGGRHAGVAPSSTTPSIPSAT